MLKVMSQKNIKLLTTRKNRFNIYKYTGGLGERFKSASGYVTLFGYPRYAIGANIASLLLFRPYFFVGLKYELQS